MFVEIEIGERDSVAYGEFPAKLNRRKFQAAEYKWVGKGGKEVWIQASYNPVLDVRGKSVKGHQIRYRCIGPKNHGHGE
ncbi:hypothetical protein ABIB82_006054 [Bradyrhizobium sp. i1.8.4]|uniref:hypothetical protein n=1 Tax=unclassified Bradyrhizobium TaxID=2631580 RepID=UPI003D1E857B